MRPGRVGSRRSRAALISGKVAPNRIDCGRIRSAEIVHFATCRPMLKPSAGNNVSYAAPVTDTNTRWKRTPINAMASSIRIYQRSGSRIRSVRAPIHSDPSDIPPRKIAITSICAYAEWPTKRLR